MNVNDENLKTLLKRFVDDAAAKVMAEEISKGDALLNRFSAPSLDGRAAERIRGRVVAACAARARRRLIFSTGGIAAAAMVMVLLFHGSDQTQSPARPESRPLAAAATDAVTRQSQLPAHHLWEDRFYTEGGASYTAIQDELDNIAASIEAVRLRASDFTETRILNGDAAEPAGRLLDKTDFWKG